MCHPMPYSPPHFDKKPKCRPPDSDSPLDEFTAIMKAEGDESFHSPQQQPAYSHDRTRSWEGQGHDSSSYRRDQPPRHSGPIMSHNNGPFENSGHAQYAYGHPMPPPAYTSSSFESYGSGPYPHPHYVVSAPIITYPFAAPGMHHHPGAFYPSWGPPPKPIEYIHNIKSSDVLCGRGGATNSHSGNRSFRALVKRHQDRYLRAKKRDKPAVASSIVDLIRERGGRFLRRCETSMQGDILWVDIGHESAREKTCQALREGAPELRRRKGRGASTSSDDEDREESPKQKRKVSPLCQEDIEDEKVSPYRIESPKSSSPTMQTEATKPEEPSDARDDLESIGEGSSMKMSEEGPMIIRPCSRLMRRPVRDIPLSELSPREQEMYLHDFLPPHPNIKEKTHRKRVILTARAYSPAIESENEDDVSESWEV